MKIEREYDMLYSGEMNRFTLYNDTNFRNLVPDLMNALHTFTILLSILHCFSQQKEQQCNS